MKQEYKKYRPRQKTLDQIEVMNEIIADYMADGYRLTVRQLYYQLVSRNEIPNTERSYQNTISLVSNARLGGLMDWNAIEDRTRAVRSQNHWNNVEQIIRATISNYYLDRWDNQKYRPIVMIEKDALIGVIQSMCDRLDVPYLSCRGYASQTVLRNYGYGRMATQIMRNKHPVILHLGDLDPSGLDMSRDLSERLAMFSDGIEGIDFTFKRIALSMEQVDELQPPPNPAKVTDSRFEAYREIYGEESWELDALPPAYINDLLKKEIKLLTDGDKLAEVEKLQKVGTDYLTEVSGNTAFIEQALKYQHDLELTIAMLEDQEEEDEA